MALPEFPDPTGGPGLIPPATGPGGAGGDEENTQVYLPSTVFWYHSQKRFTPSSTETRGS